MPLSSKRLADRQPVRRDWHSADIVAALKKAGWSLRQLSVANDYKPGTLNLAMRKKWPKAESIIAKAIGLPPWAIWPSRYPDRQH